jgi:hypothetical protein
MTIPSPRRETRPNNKGHVHRALPLVAAFVAFACGSSGSSASAPTFAGVVAVAPASTSSVFVTWAPGKDAVSAVEQLRYRVYVGATPDTVDYGNAVATSDPGARYVVVPNLRADATYAIGVRAVNTGGQEDTNHVTLPGAPGIDVAAPTFKGVRAATRESDGSLTLTWDAATDDHTPVAALLYQVFQSDRPDRFDFTKPTLVSGPGDTSGKLTGPFQTDHPYYFAVRARDAANNVDPNTLTIVHGFVTDDAKPPSFGGLTGATVDPQARTAALTWDPATDDKTPAGEIVYEIFEATSPGAYDYKSPPAHVSAPGATGATLTSLAGDAKLSWVVRARDLGNNEDVNATEQGGTTDVSFAANIQGIFTYNCAVVGCHVPGNPPAGLVLAAGFAFAQTVNVAAAESPSLMRITPSAPDTSYLYQKVLGTASRGTQMPAPATGNVLTDLDKDRIRRWIANGAMQN